MDKSANTPHHAIHYVTRVGWLRASVLGANDGIISTSSLLTGVAASGAPHGTILLSGAAALVAGAMSMAAGEYVSVSAQSDTERADLAKERKAIARQPEVEWEELRDIYVERGLDPELAAKVSDQLMAADALEAHARDELGISAQNSARPVQAAFASAASFTVGACPPLLIALLSPKGATIPYMMIGTAICLALLGYLGARLGGANCVRSVSRTVFWGLLAMLTTFLVGRLFDIAP